MRGIWIAILGGGFLTLQGVFNSRISQDIGTWQTAAVTQMTGFLAALVILLFVPNKEWRNLKQVYPPYLIGGTFGAVIIFSTVTAIHYIGVTLTTSILLIAQLGITFLIDSRGWFGLNRQKMRVPQFIGIGMMVAGVVILGT